MSITRRRFVQAAGLSTLGIPCRGPVAFDQYGNVSQFWTYKPEEFLKNPVYSRDYPPPRNLES